MIWTYWNSMRLPRFSNYNWLISVRHYKSCVFLCLKGATAYTISIATNSCYVTWRIVKEILTYTLGRGAQRTRLCFHYYLTSKSAFHILSVPSQLSAFHKPKVSTTDWPLDWLDFNSRVSCRWSSDRIFLLIIPSTSIAFRVVFI